MQHLHRILRRHCRKQNSVETTSLTKSKMRAVCHAWCCQRQECQKKSHIIKTKKLLPQKHRVYMIHIPALQQIVQIKAFANEGFVSTAIQKDVLLHSPVGVGVVVMSGRLHVVMVAHWPRMPEMWVRVQLWAQNLPFSSYPWHWLLWPWSFTSYVLYGCWTYLVYLYVKPLPVCM